MLSVQDQIRAWKDPKYRQVVSAESLPLPCGSIELNDGDLMNVVAGGSNVRYRWPKQPSNREEPKRSRPPSQPPWRGGFPGGGSVHRPK